MSDRFTKIDVNRFGPWALVTGASSGLGREFARQLAANGLNVVLAARRQATLVEVGQELAQRYGVQYRAVRVDLADSDFLAGLAAGVDDLDVGLVVSNAGDMVLGEFLDGDRGALLAEARLNTTTHLELAHHFGRRMADRGRGGVLLVSSLAGVQGVPYIANYSAAKAYLLTLGEALHRELGDRGVGVTVLVPGAVDTPMMARFGADQTAMGRLAAPVRAVVSEGLAALRADRAVRVNGRMNRAILALTPRSSRIRLFGAMNRSMVDRAVALSRR